jgi:hypothetical protein
LLNEDKDIANHQIRSLRHLLVEDTVNFEQRYFLHRIAKREIDTTEALQWFQQEASTLESGSLAPSNDKKYVFFSRLLSSIDPSTGIKLPDSTFVFDIDRLYNIEQEMIDLTRLRVCHRIYSKLILGSEVEANQSSFALMYNWTEAILSDVCSPERWTDCARLISVEVSRKLSKPTLASTVEEQIIQGMDSESSVFNAAKREVSQNVEIITRAYAKKYVAFTPGAIAGSWNAIKMKSTLPIYWYLVHDLARRLAHIGLLHWQIWAPLVYSKSQGNENLSIEDDV